MGTDTARRRRDYSYALDAAETTFRWVVSIDGNAGEPGVDIRVRDDGDVKVLLLVAGAEEVELHRWNPTTRNAAVREPGRLVHTLGDLQRRRDA